MKRDTRGCSPIGVFLKGCRMEAERWKLIVLQALFLTEKRKNGDTIPEIIWFHKVIISLVLRYHYQLGMHLEGVGFHVPNE